MMDWNIFILKFLQVHLHSVVERTETILEREPKNIRVALVGILQSGVDCGSKTSNGIILQNILCVFCQLFIPVYCTVYVHYNF